MNEYARWKPEVRAQVQRLTEERDRRNAALKALDRFAFLPSPEGPRLTWCGSRRAFRHWDRARLRWVRALDAWRAVALMAANLAPPVKPKPQPKPQGTSSPTISGGWYGTATDWRAIQEQRRLARLRELDRKQGRVRTTWPEDD